MIVLFLFCFVLGIQWFTASVVSCFVPFLVSWDRLVSCAITTPLHPSPLPKQENKNLATTPPKSSPFPRKLPNVLRYRQIPSSSPRPAGRDQKSRSIHQSPTKINHSPQQRGTLLVSPWRIVQSTPHPQAKSIRTTTLPENPSILPNTALPPKT